MTKNFFRSARLTYRAVESTDTRFFHNLIADADAFANTAPLLLQPMTRHFSEGMQKLGSETLLSVIICLTSASSGGESSESAHNLNIGDTDTPIGALYLSKSPPAEQHHRNTNLAINLSATHQGKGYGSEAIRWALDWAFRMAGLHRVGLNVLEWNDGARRLYEKLGFVAEGRQRQALWFDGRWWDRLYFGLLEGEWKESAKVVHLNE